MYCSSCIFEFVPVFWGERICLSVLGRTDRETSLIEKLTKQMLLDENLKGAGTLTKRQTVSLSFQMLRKMHKTMLFGLRLICITFVTK